MAPLNTPQDLLEHGWLSPFAIFCGLGLCVGYALLGACWLVKNAKEVRATRRTA